MKKSIFLFFAALLFSASAWAGWCGDSFITVNGLWCTGSNSYVHDGGKFHGKDLGTLTTLELGGEFQVWPSSTTAGTLCYKIDNGTEKSISLPKTGTNGENSKHSGSGVVDLSGLAGGSHSIAVWFKHGSDIDNNGGSNFVATFTIAAATPEPDPTPDPAETETVYFVNAEDWAGTIYAYAWKDGTPKVENASWAGVVAQKEPNQIGGHDVYSYTAEKGKYAKVIFNNNSGKQTSDMTWTAGQYICKNEWFVDEAAVLTKLNGPIEYVSVYFINTVKWSAVNIYTWSPEVKTWPGVAMTKEAEQIGGFDVYSYTVEKGTTFGGMKFNENGGNQTGDLQWTDGKYYIYNYGEVVGWFTKEQAEAKLAAPIVTYDYYIAGTEAMTGHNWNPVGLGIEDNDEDGIYSHTFTLDAGGDYQFKVTQDADWDPNWGYSKLDKAYDGVTNSGDDGENIKINLTETKTITVHFDSKAGSISLEGLDSQDKVTYDYYIAGTLPGALWNPASLGMTKEGDVYKATFSELPAETYEFKITDGQWNSDGDNTHEHTTLGAVYEEVSYNEGNIQIVTEEAINLTVIFNAATDKITFEGLTEKAPAEPVTVYFINSGNWAEVACHYWGGLNGSTWPGVQMDLTAETYEAEGWKVYKVTFPGDNTSCIFNDNKAEDATQTADLQVENGKYYCYANGIWYERLADVDPLDTRIYLKGDMNEWCTIEGWCDMFRKETVDGTVAYRTVYLEEANTTYEFKIEDAGTWLSNEGTMTKDNCTDWLFEKDLNNAKITTEYVGEYTFVWDMTTKKLSVVYPELVPEVMDLMVTDMVFDEDAMSFSGTDNTYGIAFNLVIGAQLEYGVYSLDASSTVNFGGTPFTDVTGMIAPDMDYFASATAQVSGFLGGTYYQLNVQMSAGGAAGVPVEILDGTASVDGAGELTISGNWDGDDVYVVAPGFNGVTYDCDEVWFYVGGTTWETASIIAFGPASITVDGNDVLVEGTVMSGMTGTNYDLYVIGTLPAEETPDYTRTVASGSYGTICLPNGSVKVEGAKFYEVTFKKDGYIYADEVTTLDAGMPYIFHATSTEVKVYYNETTATAGSNNGVYGTFSDITDGDAGTTGNVLEGNYLLVAGPKVQKCAGNCSLAANRAYFVVSEISDVEQQSAPGRQRIALGCQDENQATGLDNITENGAIAPALQGTYDILGRQLSEPAVSGFYIINGKKVLVVK